MGASRKPVTASVPVQRPPLCDMIVTVGIAFTRTAPDYFDVAIYVGTDGEPAMTDAVIACEVAGELRGPVSEIVAVIAKALGGHRVPAEGQWLGSGPVGRA